MKSCEQAPGWTIYQHGMDVANRYRDLYEWLHGEENRPRYGWHLGGCEEQLKSLAYLALTPAETRTYQILHDCGKPRALQIDEQGRRHYPNHAKLSAELFREALPEDVLSALLIEQDMLCHTLRGDDLKEFASTEHSPTLILTAWAELHSNAEKIFGGFEADSFKIKRKQLIKATKLIHESHQMIPS